MHIFAVVRWRVHHMNQPPYCQPLLTTNTYITASGVTLPSTRPTRRGGSHGQISTIKATQDACGASWRGSGRWPIPSTGNERERERLQPHSVACWVDISVYHQKIHHQSFLMSVCLCIQQRKVAGEVSGTEREKEIVLEAERLEIRDKAPLVLAELLYDTNMIAQIKQYRTLFCRVRNLMNSAILKYDVSCNFCTHST